MKSSVTYAIKRLIECDENDIPWIMHTNDEARVAVRHYTIINELQAQLIKCETAAAERDKHIDELDELIAELRMTGSDRAGKLEDRARKAEVYKDEITRLRKALSMEDKEIRSLVGWCVARGDQLKKIEDVVGKDVLLNNPFMMIKRVQKIIEEE